MNLLNSPLGATALAAALAVGGFFGGTYLLETTQFAHAQQQVEATREQLAQIEDLATVFRHVGRSIEPAVVNIQVIKEVEGFQRTSPFQDDLLRRFFPDLDGDGEPDVPPEFRQPDSEPFRQMGNGSGVIMEVTDGKGYILTNNHVAGGATQMVIKLNDGREIKDGKLIGADPKTDLAVIEIEADNLIAAPWGNSDDLQKGDWIMAFGSPFGYVGSMTHGIVSALNRDNIGILGAGGYENFIQVDAPINPGNSGGPLVNIRGQVVGINTAIASRTGGFQGIGFAIPSNQAKIVYEQLRQSGKVTRGWLGVKIKNVSDLDPGLTESFGYDARDGVFIEETYEGTPAYNRLEPGDIVMELNGRRVTDMQMLRNAIAITPPGTEVKMKVFREGKEQEIALTVAEQPEDLAVVARRGGGGSEPGQAPSADVAKSLGLTLTNITPELARRYGLQDMEAGALVASVDPRSPAAERGLRPGDVITRVGNERVNNAAEAIQALKNHDLNKGVRLYVTGREGSRFVFLKREK